MKKTIIFIILFCILTFGIQFANDMIFRFGIQKYDMKSDLWEVNMENLALNKTDMQGTYYGLGYEFFINRMSSVDIELGTYKKVRNTMYKDYNHSDDSPIYQSLSLNVNSIEANLNILPLGYRRTIYPYLSVGGGVYIWTYEQWGEFINFEEETINEGLANTQTISFGANVKGGLVIRVGRSLGLSFEGKYTYMKGALSSDFEGFEPLDLNNITMSVGVHYFMW